MVLADFFHDIFTRTQFSHAKQIKKFFIILIKIKKSGFGQIWGFELPKNAENNFFLEDFIIYCEINKK